MFVASMPMRMLNRSALKRLNNPPCSTFTPGPSMTPAESYNPADPEVAPDASVILARPLVLSRRRAPDDSAAARPKYPGRRRQGKRIDVILEADRALVPRQIGIGNAVGPALDAGWSAAGCIRGPLD